MYENIHSSDMYGCETRSMTVQLSTPLDAFDTCCLRMKFRISYTRQVTNEVVYHLFMTPDIFSHVTRLPSTEDHHRSRQSDHRLETQAWSTSKTWLIRTIEADIRPLNYTGCTVHTASARHMEIDRQKRRKTISTAKVR